mmetsp:Transcript_105252/g.307679  ORF Transcript_105252/g.307679 Transcript_105252/m.307679 type:complete len:303 (-) Transcript_105252:53-961(-)
MVALFRRYASAFGVVDGNAFIEAQYSTLNDMVINLTVIGSLLISVTTAAAMSISREMYQDFEFDLLMRRQTFRQFVVHVMDTEDIGQYERETFNWTWSIVNPTRTLDLRAIALTGGDFAEEDLNQELTALIARLRPKFPMDKMTAWSSLQDPSSPDFHAWTRIGRRAWWSQSLQALPIIIGVVLYLAMATSGAQESGEVRAMWTLLVPPLAMVGYILEAVGFWIAVHALDDVMSLQAPGCAHMRMLNASPKLFLLALTLIYLAVAIVGSAVSWLRFFRRRRKEKSEPEDSGPAVREGQAASV